MDENWQAQIWKHWRIKIRDTHSGKIIINILVWCWTTISCKNSLIVTWQRFYKSLELYWTMPVKYPDVITEPPDPLTVGRTLQSEGNKLSETRPRRWSDSHPCRIWDRIIMEKIPAGFYRVSGTNRNLLNKYVHPKMLSKINTAKKKIHYTAAWKIVLL